MTSWTCLARVGFRDRANLHVVLLSRPPDPIRDMLVAPVVVDHRVSLPTMIAVASDACEFTDSDR